MAAAVVDAHATVASSAPLSWFGRAWPGSIGSTCGRTLGELSDAASQRAARALRLRAVPSGRCSDVQPGPGPPTGMGRSTEPLFYDRSEGGDPQEQRLHVPQVERATRVELEQDEVRCG